MFTGDLPNACPRTGCFCPEEMKMQELLSKGAVVLSCEHGGNYVPGEFCDLFEEASGVLISHRGWDLGALELFFEMVGKGVDYSLYSETTRLLIDLNRSLNKRSLFSEFTSSLTKEEKELIIKQFYFPFREQFKRNISDLIGEQGFVLHVSVHSFTPVFKGEVRDADVGLLYDPGFGIEKDVAELWKHILMDRMPHLKIRMNYPYLGKTDGHVFALRNQFGSSHYAGIELEINQKYAFREDFNHAIGNSFQELIKNAFV
jgi:predicted N-formylglutamate amidohydrolase